MKILILKDKEALYIYHHPRNVKYNKKRSMITIGETEPVTFHLKEEPMVQFIELPNSEDAELFVSFEILDSDKDIHGIGLDGPWK